MSPTARRHGTAHVSSNFMTSLVLLKHSKRKCSALDNIWSVNCSIQKPLVIWSILDLKLCESRLAWALLNWWCKSHSVHELPEYFLAELCPTSDNVNVVEQSFHCPVPRTIHPIPSFLEVEKQASKVSESGEATKTC